jgi:hypothetical protein
MLLAQIALLGMMIWMLSAVRISVAKRIARSFP